MREGLENLPRGEKGERVSVFNLSVIRLKGEPRVLGSETNRDLPVSRCWENSEWK